MVYLFKPARLAGHLGVATDDTARVSLAHKQILAGLPVTEDRAPQSVTRTDDLENPFDGYLPHLFELTFGQFVVSELVKSVFDARAAGHCMFHPVSIGVVLNQGSPQKFYYLDIVARSRRINWAESSLKYRDNPTKDGRPVILVDSICRSSHYCFKPSIAGSPPIWREMGAESSEYVWKVDHFNIFVDEWLWSAIDEACPGELEPVRMREQ